MDAVAVVGVAGAVVSGRSAGGVWAEITGVQPRAPWWVAGLAVALAVAAVLVRRAWPVARNVVTVAHEGGHVLVGLLTGRTVTGVRLHSDTSGVTTSSGAAKGVGARLGLTATAFAGYVSPGLLGLGGARLLEDRHPVAVLWTVLVLLAGMLVLIRNAFGALSVLASGGAVFAAAWWGPAEVRSGAAFLLVAFLLVAGPRPVWELRRSRAAGVADGSDADELARLTGVPGAAWVAAFGAVSVGCLLVGGVWLAGGVTV